MDAPLFGGFDGQLDQIRAQLRAKYDLKGKKVKESEGKLIL